MRFQASTLRAREISEFTFKHSSHEMVMSMCAGTRVHARVHELHKTSFCYVKEDDCRIESCCDHLHLPCEASPHRIPPDTTPDKHPTPYRTHCRPVLQVYGDQIVEMFCKGTEPKKHHLFHLAHCQRVKDSKT